MRLRFDKPPGLTRILLARLLLRVALCLTELGHMTRAIRAIFAMKVARWRLQRRLRKLAGLHRQEPPKG